MKVAVVGATGLVGSKMLQVLEERNFPVTELLPVASSRSWGKKVMFQGREWTVMSADEAIARRPVVAIFSAGGAASGELAPRFAAVGCRVVEVPETHPAFYLRGTENAILIRSAFHPTPIVIQGPGEGARQAAASLLNDILR